VANYILRRVVGMIPTVIIISIIAFVLIQLPPGDILTARIAQLESQTSQITEEQVQQLYQRYGLDRPIYEQYWMWITSFVQGDMGYSLSRSRPVRDLIFERLPLTLIVALSSMLFTWVMSVPIGIYSAVKKYTVFDYIFTFVGFLGLSVPNFMLALILMFVAVEMGWPAGGLFSPEYVAADWSWDKFINLLQHLWVPMIVIGTAGTARMIRIIRANLLDELEKPYVTTAKAKGVKRNKMLIKYPVRIAINPLVSTIGWMLPMLFSGEVIASVVLSLPTIGVLLLQSLMTQDMFLAGGIVLMLSMLTVIGTLISDLLLAVLDPRIRYE